MDDKARQEAEEAYLASQLSPDAGAASPLRRIRIRAVIVGVIVDWLMTAVMLFAYALVFMEETLEKHGGFENFDKIPEHAFQQEDLLALGLLGTLATALGGYVAGRIARRRQVLHGVVVAVTSLLLSAVLELVTYGSVQVSGWEVPFLILMIPAGALGGYVAHRFSEPPRPLALDVPMTPMS